MPIKGLPSLLERHWAESTLAIGAIFIAAISLWVAYDTARSDRQLVASERQMAGSERQVVASERHMVTESAWPFVQVIEGNAVIGPRPRQVERVWITNSGVGPAKVESIELFWNGTAYSGWRPLAHACCGYRQGEHEKDAMDTSSVTGVLRPGQRLLMLYYPRSFANSDTWRKLGWNMGNFQFKICYCSVFDQCWITDGQSLHPNPVSVCQVPKVPYTG